MRERRQWREVRYDEARQILSLAFSCRNTAPFMAGFSEPPGRGQLYGGDLVSITMVDRALAIPVDPSGNAFQHLLDASPIGGRFRKVFDAPE
jgi:hypothetical protein